MPSSTTLRACALLTVGVSMALLLPRLAQDGMFMDGELYAAVAHNQANGYGTFWEPRFSQVGVAGLATFHEHPPLVFGMQAAWFGVFGSGFWVERSYALLMALVTALLLALLWREWVPGRLGRGTVWWPLLLWIIVPTVFWSCHNNMIENTMGVFTTAAVLLVVKGAGGRWWRWYPAAAFCVFLASLCKGLPGLFPLAAPVLVRVASRSGNWGRAMLMSALMTVLVGLCHALLMAWPEANANLSTYVEKRLLHRIAEVPTVAHRWASLEMLLSNMLGPLLLALVLWVSTRRQPSAPGSGWRRQALAMLLVGLSGVLPLMLTMVQKSFYMAAALPLVVMAVALWSLPFLLRAMERVSRHAAVVRALRVAGTVAVLGAVVVAVVLFGTPARDGDLLRDVRRIGSVVPPHTKVGLPEAMWNEWSLQTYLMRYGSISLDSGPAEHEWYLTGQGEIPPREEDYLLVEIGLERTSLWRRKPS